MANAIGFEPPPGSKGGGPEPPPGSKGGGPVDDPQRPRRDMASQGFLTVGLGFAVGVALVVLFLLVNLTGDWLAVPATLKTFASKLWPNVMWAFLFGMVSGSVISLVYNLLLSRRQILFGLETDIR